MGRRVGLFFCLAHYSHVGHDVALVTVRVDPLAGAADVGLAEDIHDVSCERGTG